MGNTELMLIGRRYQRINPYKLKCEFLVTKNNES